MEPRRLQVLLPPEVALGVKVPVGTWIQVPLTIDSTGLSTCAITTTTSAASLSAEQPRRGIALSPQGGTVQIVIRLRGSEPTDEPAEVSVVVAAEGLQQEALFPVEVLASPPDEDATPG